MRQTDQNAVTAFTHRPRGLSHAGGGEPLWATSRSSFSNVCPGRGPSCSVPEDSPFWVLPVPL